MDKVSPTKSRIDQKPTRQRQKQSIPVISTKQQSNLNQFSPSPSSSTSLLAKTTVFILLLSISQINLTFQQQSQTCPKPCHCDEVNLETICKDSFGLSGIPHILNPNTRRIIINYAQTTQFSGLDYLGRLEIVDLANNRIGLIDSDEVSKNSILVSLNVSHNIIAELKDSAVTRAFNHIGTTKFTLPETSEDLKVFRKLDKINVHEFILSHNLLTILKNFTFLRWHKLTKLDLSYNSIQLIESDSFFGLNKLESLNLRGNRLTQIPTTTLIATSKSLSFSSITYPQDPRPIPLKHLDLSENQLLSLGSNAFNPLERLQELYLESCLISFIDDRAFNGLHTLNTLSLDNNHLREIPTSSFSYLAMLRTLKLSANNISNVPQDSFTDLIHLEELQLNNESLDYIDHRAFNGLGGLRRLEVANNQKLTRIEPGTFSGLPRLSYLSLRANALSSVSNDFHGSMQVLDLRNNPLYCDCDLKWLTKWLRQLNETTNNLDAANKRTLETSNHDEPLSAHLAIELVSLTCSGPPALEAKLVAELPNNPLECLEPTSDLNVRIGFATLFFMISIMTAVCLLNLCQNKKHLLNILKNNFASTQMSLMRPYEQNLHKNVSELRKETQLGDYEHIDYAQQTAPIYTINSDNVVYYEAEN